MKLLCLSLAFLLLVGCAHHVSQDNRAPASTSAEDELDDNPARYNIVCGAIMPASQHFDLTIKKGASTATIRHTDTLSPMPTRKIVSQDYAVKLADTPEAYVYSGKDIELQLPKNAYTVNGDDEILVESKLKAKFQGKDLGISAPNCILEEPK